MLLPAKMRTLGQPPISHLQGWFFQLAIVLSRFFTITPSLPPIYFPVAADSLTDSRSAGVLASVSWRQWQRMQVITIPSQRLLLCLGSLCGWFQGTLTPSRTSALLEPLHKKGHILQPSPQMFLHFCLRESGGGKSHSGVALSKPADDFHWFRNRLGQSRDRCREER